MHVLFSVVSANIDHSLLFNDNLMVPLELQVVDGCLPVEAVEEKLGGLAMDCIAMCQKGKPLTNLWSSK